MRFKLWGLESRALKKGTGAQHSDNLHFESLEPRTTDLTLVQHSPDKTIHPEGLHFKGLEFEHGGIHFRGLEARAKKSKELKGLHSRSLHFGGL